MIKLIGNLGNLGFNGTVSAKSLFMVFTSIRQFFRSIKTKTNKKKTKVILLSVYYVKHLKNICSVNENNIQLKV